MTTDTTVPGTGHDAAGTMLDQLSTSCLFPDLERRQNAGQLPNPYPLSHLRGFQILFSIEPPHNTVRINDEIKARVEVALADGSVQTIDAIGAMTLDVKAIRYIALLPEDADYGHATFFRVDGTWQGWFSFIYKQGVARRYLRVARQFLDAARQSATSERWPPFLENLFAAHELAAKAWLLCYGKHYYQGNVNHQTIKADINKQRHIGNVAPEHAELFNYLAKQRGPARYAEKEVTLTPLQAADYLSTAETLIERAERYADIEDE